MRKTLFFGLLSLGLVSFACSGDSGSDGSDPAPPTADSPGDTEGDTGLKTPSFAEVQELVLNLRCISCHSGPNARGGVNLTNYDLIMQTQSVFGDDNSQAPTPLVVAGKPDESLIWKVVDVNRMPRAGGPLSDEQKALLKNWIESGANP